MVNHLNITALLYSKSQLYSNPLTAEKSRFNPVSQFNPVSHLICIPFNPDPGGIQFKIPYIPIPTEIRIPVDPCSELIQLKVMNGTCINTIASNQNFRKTVKCKKNYEQAPNKTALFMHNFTCNYPLHLFPFPMVYFHTVPRCNSRIMSDHVVLNFRTLKYVNNRCSVLWFIKPESNQK